MNRTKLKDLVRLGVVYTYIFIYMYNITYSNCKASIMVKFEVSNKIKSKRRKTKANTHFDVRIDLCFKKNVVTDTSNLPRNTD